MSRAIEFPTGPFNTLVIRHTWATMLNKRRHTQKDRVAALVQYSATSIALRTLVTAKFGADVALGPLDAIAADAVVILSTGILKVPLTIPRPVGTRIDVIDGPGLASSRLTARINTAS